MDDATIGRMFFNRVDKYGPRTLFKVKRDGEYVNISWNEAGKAARDSRSFGSSEACRLTTPADGMVSSSCGMIGKATTTHNSAATPASRSRMSWMSGPRRSPTSTIGMPHSSATGFRGVATCFLPRPAAASGLVMRAVSS